ncbi:hypothetical protein UMZ34_18755 [Halopseudomonas pachastrellae]|nr:hypothetical protein UMZ34_18755 [Halopseudomonas pachastrellae]
MWRTLEDLRRTWRPWFVVGFFALLALGLYLGMRPTPPPAAYSWQASLYHGGGIFALTLLSFLAFARWPWWLRAVLLSLVGVAVELVQSLHPTRSTTGTTLSPTAPAW